MQHPAILIVYINPSFNVNKSLFNWTQVCQLHLKTQLHENYLQIYQTANIYKLIYRRYTHYTNKIINNSKLWGLVRLNCSWFMTLGHNNKNCHTNIYTNRHQIIHFNLNCYDFYIIKSASNYVASVNVP